jgi:hypothetical protein
MLEFLTPEIPQSGNKRSMPSRLTLIAASALLFAFFAIFSPWSRSGKQSNSSKASHLAFGPQEQAYASSLRVDKLALSRAENFLHQEITTLSGKLANSGNRSLKNVELTVVFYDDLHQIVLRESRQTSLPADPPISPATLREFEISFEHVPPSWNMQEPSVYVTGLQFAGAK